MGKRMRSTARITVLELIGGKTFGCHAPDGVNIDHNDVQAILTGLVAMEDAYQRVVALQKWIHAGQNWIRTCRRSVRLSDEFVDFVQELCRDCGAGMTYAYRMAREAIAITEDFAVDLEKSAIELGQTTWPRPLLNKAKTMQTELRAAAMRLRSEVGGLKKVAGL